MATNLDPTVATGRTTVSIDVYSDVVCPWCYIGKRRFAAGVAMVEDEVGVEVTYRAYQLDPTAAPGAVSPVFDAYARKFGGPERARQIIDHVTATAAEVGLDFRMDRALRANSLLAHRLIWWAGRPDSSVPQDAMKERLLRAYFTHGLDIGDPEVLAGCAAEIGVDREVAAAFLDGDGGLAEVRGELEEAYRQGISAVPTYVVGGQWAIPGAQEPETFARVLRKLGEKAAAT